MPPLLKEIPLPSGSWTVMPRSMDHDFCHAQEVVVTIQSPTSVVLLGVGCHHRDHLIVSQLSLLPGLELLC